MTTQDPRTPFKRCPYCAKEWESREEFLADGHNRLNGYLCNSKRIRAGVPVDGMLVFTHHHESCGTTLALPATHFKGDRKKEGRRDDDD